ncbi:pyridoxal-phosphate dependent enzyme [Thalassobaculum sp.]|uniref:1-aminocyclopropane-1-carboxylate deaminase/D-cysteine desulfhydrase n=1 Tax=Thalassobaculum sp. TaxID=2022740 RepID=UPI0032F03D0F
MLEHLPRIDLLDGPTPLQRMSRVEAHAGHQSLWVKRDDFMPLGLGGNKLRSLEYWIAEAARDSCDILVVAGAPESNQCRLTAATAARLGMDCLILHGGDPPANEVGNLMLNRLLGAEIRFLGPVDEAQRGERAQQAVGELARAGRRPYLIGNPVVGALGYARAAEELARQARAHDLALRHVVLSGSMGPTEAGFLFGCALLDLDVTVHLVSVEYSAEELEARIGRILDGLSRHTGADPRADWRHRLSIHMDQLGDGYGRPTAASVEAVRTAARLEGFFLEHTYTAKTFAGLLQRIADGTIPADEPACFLHTGGTPALFGQVARDPSLLGDGP